MREGDSDGDDMVVSETLVFVNVNKKISTHLKRVLIIFNNMSQRIVQNRFISFYSAIFKDKTNSLKSAFVHVTGVGYSGLPSLCAHSTI